MVVGHSISAPASVILIVDDMATNLKVLRGHLAKTKHQLSFASSGSQALERVSITRPDLILLDLMMPEMDGLEVCQRLKLSYQTADIPIIFLTASHEDEHLLQAFELGAVDYVTKPFRPSELLARIETHLSLAHLQTQLQQRALQETILRHVIEDLHSSFDLRTILSRAAAHIKSFITVDRVLICRCFSSDSCAIMTTTDPAFQPTALPIELQTFQSRAQVSVIQSDSLKAGDAEWLKRWDVHTELRFPIFQKTELWGAMIVHLSSDSLPDSSINLLQTVVEQLQIAIQQFDLYSQLQTAKGELSETVDELEQANSELERIAHIDSLTQLANRRYFDTYIDREWLRLRREHQPLTIILMDIDYFKLYNDAYGHLQGDVCLRAVAQALREVLKRPADVLARYGGEEFVALLPKTDKTGAVQMAQYMQHAIAQFNVPHAASRVSDRITISLGIATRIPTQHDSWLNLLNDADKALYQAKENGRNQCSIADALSLQVTTQESVT